MIPVPLRILSVIALLSLAACAPNPATVAPPATLPGYEAVQDGEILVPEVGMAYLQGSAPRADVDYAGNEAPGTIVVDTHSRRLYHVQEGGRATRYAIAVGRAGLAFRGSATVGRKAEWPGWTPTANMIRTFPDMYSDYAGGLPGGLNNPLGARALYLYRGNRDTYFRIHGTNESSSIGRATSAGCIRLFNQDAMDLFDNVRPGTKVKVRTLDESLALEGPMMDDENGRAVSYDPLRAEAIAQAKAQAAALLAGTDAVPIDG